VIDFLAYKRIINFRYLELPETCFECIPCLITHNDFKKSRLYIAQKSPRKEFWMEEKVPFHKQVIKYFYNDLQAKISRRNQRVKAFFDYKKKPNQSEVFQTLTDAPSSRIDIREFIRLQKQHLQRNGVKVIKYVWVLELKRRDDGSIHAHYHIVWLTSRTNRIKLWYKSGLYWGRRTNSEFVKKSAQAYIMKYLSKTDLLCANYRTFGKSVERSERTSKHTLVSVINSDLAYYFDAIPEGDLTTKLPIGSNVVGCNHVAGV